MSSRVLNRTYNATVNGAAIVKIFANVIKSKHSHRKSKWDLMDRVIGTRCLVDIKGVVNITAVAGQGRGSQARRGHLPNLFFKKLLMINLFHYHYRSYCCCYYFNYYRTHYHHYVFIFVVIFIIAIVVIIIRCPMVNASSKILSIRVISGQCLPKPENILLNQQEIVDPYVVVEVMGVPIDCFKVGFI
jgi:hypothetical protein